MLNKLWSFCCREQRECFICYSSTGKSELELLHEEIYGNKTMNYPLLSMSHVYKCNCINNYAHNRCVLHINKCPLCRKESKPNLYINTQYEYYFKYILKWIKKDISHIEKLDWYMIYYLIFTCGLIYIFSERQDVKCSNNKIIGIIFSRSKVYPYLSTFFCLLFICILFMYATLNDYLVKYWLYDENKKKFNIFFMLD